MGKFKARKVTFTPEEKAKNNKARATAERNKDKIVAIARAQRAIDEAWVKIFGELKAARQQQGLTLDDLAEKTGISKPALSVIENEGNTNPKIGTLRSIATALGKTIEMTLVDVAPGGKTNGR